ncbi:nitrogen fixation protein NifR [Staphylococcus aureus]|nr:nitrogen fixation protein NifR [Staphylococcus aureus]
MSKRNSTNNASWGKGSNIEADGKSAYNNVQIGVGQRNKFCKKYHFCPTPFLRLVKSLCLK